MSYKVYVYGSRKSFSTDGLALGTCLPFDIFVNEGNVFTKLYSAGQAFGPAERAELLSRGAGEVYVDARDAVELDAYLHRTSDEVPSNPEDPVTVREYVEHKAQYYQVDRTFLIPGKRIDFGVFRLTDLRLVPVVDLVDNGFGIIPGGLASLRGDIVIRNEDIPLYQRYLDLVMEDMARSAPSAEEKQKIQAFAIKEKSKSIVKDLLEDPRSGENIKKGIQVVSDLTERILSNRNVLLDLLTLSSYDQYTYTHSVNVAVLAVGIAVSCGMGRADVQNLGVGALLHDVGKSAIPAEILNKPGRLNEREYEIMKSHVLEGAKSLDPNEAVPEESRIVVLQHHERISGTGYPNHASGPEISVFGRICAIADCYDAMTTNRPYKDAGTPFQALMQMKVEKTSYDLEILDNFIRMLGKTQASRMKTAM